MIKQRKSAGYSLIELMIGISLGLLLMTGVVQLFVTSKTGFSADQAVSRTQEAGRMAIEFMSKDIRMAGFAGCLSSTSDAKKNTKLNSQTYYWDMLTPVQGFSATPANSALNPAPVNNSDLFVVTVPASDASIVSQTNTNNVVYLKYRYDSANGFNGLASNDILMISDCTKAQIFQATALTHVGNDVQITHLTGGTPGNKPTEAPSWDLTALNGTVLINVFTPGAEVSKLTRVTYYVGLNTVGQPALFQNSGGVTTELVEGIERMNITYGLDTTPTDNIQSPSVYLTAGNIAANQWANVKSLRIQLLVRSVETNIVNQNSLQQLTFAGQNVDTSDRRLRQVFTSTIAMRSLLQ